MTLYRKYRPQNLAELDNKPVRELLTRMLSTSYVPHAFLFTGPKGTGKTSAARIVAKVLNCEQRTKNKEQRTDKNRALKTPRGWQAEQSEAMTPPMVKGSGIEPCNLCETCKAITDGRHLDIIEIDAASNRGIDEIRDLREKIKLSPVSAGYKVYIIDEVHMLTAEAFNALLKTLEEPPGHAVFILATTEPDKLPATIVSRCIRINFQRATGEEIINCLHRVIKGEKINVPDEILKLIADSSDGSFRDATKILEQAWLSDSLTEEKIKAMLGRYNFSGLQFIKILSDKNTREALKQITDLSLNGVNFRSLVEDILNQLHIILLTQHGLGDDGETVKLAEKLTKTDVARLIKLFSRVFADMKNSGIAQLPLEVAVVEWCEGSK